ncbi:MAG: rod shape-determining protein MreD [Phycisphaerae bacterium]|nr:rod shape-determining protein MreD [Phycisphaerae bacterium]
MKWLSFIILIFIAVILQCGLANPLGLGPQRIMPDLLLLTAVILLLHSTGDKALVACWLAGLAKDLTSLAPFGCYALAFGLMALLLTKTRALFYDDRPIALMIFTFAATVFTEEATLFIGILKGDFHSDSTHILLPVILATALLTAILAPYAHWVLMKFDKSLGLQRKKGYRKY